MLINGAGGAVGGFAVQLAKRAGAYVVGVAGPRTAERVKALGADEVIDHSSTTVATATTPVEVVLNLAPIEPAQLNELIGLVRAGGVLVNTTVWMPAPFRRDAGRTRHQPLRQQRRRPRHGCGRSGSAGGPRGPGLAVIHLALFAPDVNVRF
ncbi:zinc-binding dehydrogenase [Dactylosporangium sp. McL0621]|uniref:zinc-binding dehydrogenase n=1 Tax=Dactylosporangium sp. McL0621 TaxID=3415678 RepID=UPI003CE825A8